MTWRDKLALGLKEDAAYRKDNLPASQIRGPEVPTGPGFGLPRGDGSARGLPGRVSRGLPGRLSGGVRHHLAITLDQPHGMGVPNLVPVHDRPAGILDSQPFDAGPRQLAGQRAVRLFGKHRCGVPVLMCWST